MAYESREIKTTYSLWQDHRAWRPVTTISGRRVWLKRVYRRQRTVLMLWTNWKGKSQSSIIEHCVEYATVFDMIRTEV